MLITTTWLLDYLEPRVSHDALLKAFPRVGLEVETFKRLDESDGYLAELNVLANRPDCLGIIGVAREIAAHFDLKLKYPTSIEPKPLAASQIKISIADPKLCSRYLAQAFSDCTIAPSPDWMQRILIALGQRPINNVVDITNFVMFEWGQPLHAFDLDQIAGKQIVVRPMQSGETLELLNGKTIDAGKSGAPPTLVIADAEKALALAGIMGGKSSETRAATTNLLLEAAHFDPPTVRRSAKRCEISSESSYRFERGCDPNRMLEGAAARATALLIEYAGAKLLDDAVDMIAAPREPRVFQLSAPRVSEFLGTTIDAATIASSLRKLEMTVSDELSVEVPTWRVDAVESVVLIEDVARLLGYDTLPTRATPLAQTLGRRSPLDQTRQTAARYLASSGFLECRTPSLEAPEQIESLARSGGILKLKNPMTRDASVLRTSLLPALVRVAERNTRRGATTTRFFELDKIYSPKPAADEPGAHERSMLAAVAGGAMNEFDWSHNTPIGFFDLKGVVEDLLEAAGARQARFEPSNLAGFRTDAAASIFTADSATPLGALGEIDGRVISTGKTPFKLFAFEIDLDALSRAVRVASYQSIARTPAIVRDLAIVVKQDVNFAEIENAIRAAAGATLESIRLVDLYRGAQIANDQKSLAFRLTFRDPNRTQTSEELQPQIDRIVKTLADQFGATLRA